MSNLQFTRQPSSADSPLLVVELTNSCNLHCSYCVRDEAALYHTPARFFPADFLRSILRAARETAGVSQVSFTGGEPTLHPRFGELLEVTGAAGMRAGFVTNGWHFDRVWPALQANRAHLRTVAFSLDGATRAAHDRWRGAGSFVRLIRAFTRCRMSGLPFSVKAGIRRDTLPQLEQIALLAARMGAAALSFSHLLPTSAASEEESALSVAERAHAEQEIALLNRIFQLPIRLDVGYLNTDPAAPCLPLRGSSINVDYRGRLTLCCNLSGFRGAADEPDVIADLTREDFAAAYARLQAAIAAQVARRAQALAALAASGQAADLYVGSPCLFCLQTFGKIPWRAGAVPAGRALPVLPAAHAQAGAVHSHAVKN